jgi:hypothetical protein
MPPWHAALLLLEDIQLATGQTKWCVMDLLFILSATFSSFWCCTTQIDVQDETSRFYGLYDRPISHLPTSTCEANSRAQFARNVVNARDLLWFKQLRKQNGTCLELFSVPRIFGVTGFSYAFTLTERIFSSSCKFLVSQGSIMKKLTKSIFSNFPKSWSHRTQLCIQITESTFSNFPEHFVNIMLNCKKKYAPKIQRYLSHLIFQCVPFSLTKRMRLCIYRHLLAWF